MRNSFIAVLLATLVFVALSFFDKDFLKVILIVWAILPILWLFDFVAHLFYDPDEEHDKCTCGRLNRCKDRAGYCIKNNCHFN